MKFTDEDLKRYKELAEKCHPLPCDLTEALIARLEAAEKAAVVNSHIAELIRAMKMPPC